MLTKGLQGGEGQSAQPSFGRDAGKATGVPSVISSNLKVVGDLHCVGDIQIDGSVEGDISTETATVGQSAKIQGSISADMVRINGSINGQIKAKSVVIAKTAHVVGDIVHETLSVEAGAFLDGVCKRLNANPALGKATVAPIEAPRIEKEAT